MERTFVVGTRKSDLAVTQTKWVLEKLKRKRPSVSFKIEYISTEGDRKVDVSLTSFGSQGVFITDLEEKLRNRTIDFAVHSLKDIPLQEEQEFTIAAIPKREDARDAYIHTNHVPLKNLPQGAIIGTSSPRRAAQLKAAYPHLETKWIRGPVDSRIEQLKRGDFDGIILAVAGLNRLGLEHVITEYLPVEKFTPAAGQGALAVQCRKNDREMIDLLESIDNMNAHQAILAERHVVSILDKEDKAPIGAYADVIEGKVQLYVSIFSPDGRTMIQSCLSGPDPILVAEDVANSLKEQGAEALIKKAKEA